MEKEQSVQGVSRRGFIKGAAVTALAAGATGTGAALLQKQNQDVTISSAAIQVPSAPTAVTNATLPQNQADLLAKLANAQAENVALQTQLTTLQQQLLNLEQTNQSESITTEALQLELDSANNQIGLLAGLVGLFEQLDSVKIDDLIENGLTAVSTNITNLLDDVPGLEEGIQLGQVALDDFEAHLPILQNGRQWLTRHLDQLRLRFNAIETILANTLEQVGPILNMIQDWFASVKKWLPFNLGQRAAEIMETVTDLILETPHTLAGMDTNLAQPLDLLISNGTEPHPIQQTLVSPIREKLIAKTSTAVSKSKHLSTVYETELSVPVKTAVDQQKIIRELIAQYREQHQI